MTWSTVPLAANDFGVIAAMTEVKAAFDERYDAVGAAFGKPAAVSGDAFCDFSDVITYYHAKIESLLGSFYQKSGSGESTTFAAYTKSSLLTECFSQTEWRDTSPGLAAVRQVNDLRTALDKLHWIRFAPNASEGEWTYMVANFTSNAVWNTCKTNAWSSMSADTPFASGSKTELAGGHTGTAGFNAANDYFVEALGFVYDAQIAFNTNSMSGITLLDGYCCGVHALTNFGTPQSEEACSCNILYDTETVKASLSINSTSGTAIGLQISDPDGRTNKAGNTYVYMTLNNPGDDVTDRESSWPASGFEDVSYYTRRGNLTACYLYLQAQFSYRAA